MHDHPAGCSFLLSKIGIKVKGRRRRPTRRLLPQFMFSQLSVITMRLIRSFAVLLTYLVAVMSSAWVRVEISAK